MGRKRRQRADARGSVVQQRLSARAEYLRQFGNDLRPTFHLCTGVPDPIRMSHLHQVLMWALADCDNPQWFCLRHRPLLNCALVVVVPGLTTHSASVLSGHLQSACRLPLSLPASSFSATCVLESIITCQIATSKAQARKQRKLAAASAPLPSASSYRLTQEELIANEYPLPTCLTDDGWRRAPPVADLASARLLAVDCEMCTTANGLELTRLSVVDADLVVLYDTLVRPASPIVDYNTRYSGITAELLEPVQTTLEEARDRLLALMGAESAILCGHSLENDLRALRIVHDHCIDTSVLYPTGRPGRKHSLRYLARRYLSTTIQDGCHDSRIDAKTTMALVSLKIANGPHFALPSASTAQRPTIMEAVHRFARRSAWIDDAQTLAALSPSIVSAQTASSPGDVVRCTTSALRSQSPFDLIVCRLKTLFDSGDADLNEGLQALLGAAPPHTLVMVVSGDPQCAEVARLQQRRVECINSGRPWSDRDDADLRDAIQRSRQGVALVTIV
ncbi:Exonuclease domain-containing protein [Plasmodiophora brassicae]